MGRPTFRPSAIPKSAQPLARPPIVARMIGNRSQNYHRPAISRCFRHRQVWSQPSSRFLGLFSTCGLVPCPPSSPLLSLLVLISTPWHLEHRSGSPALAHGCAFLLFLPPSSSPPPWVRAVAGLKHGPIELSLTPHRSNPLAALIVGTLPPVRPTEHGVTRCRGRPRGVGQGSSYGSTQEAEEVAARACPLSLLVRRERK